MSLLPARMKVIESKMKKLEWSQHFYPSMGIFSRRSRAGNFAVLGPIWPNFEHVQNVLVILVSCKYEEDPMKNEGDRVFTRFSRQLPWNPEFQSDLAQNLTQPFPHHNDASDNIWLPNLSEIFMFESVYIQTHRRQLNWNTISSPLSLRLRYSKNEGAIVLTRL